ncbi:MAG: hypothetical protein M1840_007333 [Geoglossum simile]|nr:MAG: hypothetical protein M1840_007333 [Geoglossum simile]
MYHRAILAVLAAVFPVAWGDVSPAPLTAEQVAGAYPPSVPGADNWFPTSLFGFEGCDERNRSWKGNINEAYDDANLIVNLDGVKNNINWNEAAALEFLGPAALNRDQQGQIQAVFANAATVKPRWSLIPNWIHVRCDDLLHYCPDPCAAARTGNDPQDLAAYARNPAQSADGYPEINYCPQFFTLQNLGSAIERGVSNKNRLRSSELSRYENRGSIMLHEMLHLDLVANSVKSSPNPQVKDLTVKYHVDGGTKEERVYGPALTKILARYLPFTGPKTGYFVQRSDDNLLYFALAKYVQSKIGFYPFIPQISDKIEGPPKVPNDRPTILKYTNTGDKVASFVDADITGKGCAVGANAVADVEIVGLSDDSFYPADYLSQKQNWINQLIADNAAPTDGIPDPVCVGDFPPDGTQFVYKGEGADAINKFCGQKQYWDKQLVSPVSMTDGVNKALGVDESYPVNNGSGRLWLQIAFSEDSCVGSVSFTQGTDDASKLKHCVDRFSKILNGCNTGPPDKKYGGSLNDACAVYRMKTVGTADPNPLTLKGLSELGAFKCKDTDTSAIGGSGSILAGTCTCWYEALPGNTAVFDKPAGGTCESITKSPGSTFTAKPTKRSLREPAPVVETAASGGDEVKARATRKWFA